ncbi:DegT/DnrJ/EryC1/StrS family aminotransferase [Aestuariivita sp.]|jgi:dTDP-4-amino-4,6-dideoxygalactose transaminase|uniref:DegT/DnrJ/EryC1/StrS family aminotransferase n=1 Tax=Aestuariivita sp. TaxID=1872407 RepID=UPI002171B9CC|nr:DegT/DnrJ/EryC1/StrS family aminotransferase [Aestuariivita sp.]MCE8008104.1 DegT/DnrJ/EryC1/StrS family aminotransferase [Aestuariivita sp.]
MTGPGVHFLDDEEIACVVEVLRSRQLSRYRFKGEGEAQTSYSNVSKFEAEMAGQLGVPHAIAMNSGTSALLSALVAAGVGPGDEVIVPGYTFVATMSAIVHARAIPVLAEIDESLNIDPQDVRRRITPATKAVIAVHMLGAPCEMDALKALCHEHGLVLIEDVAQAGGGTYKGKALGSWGTAGAFSLNVFKTFTAGDGGLLTTSDPELYRRAFGFHDQGFEPERAGVRPAPDLPFGLNLKMAELVGAVAYVQATKLPRILEATRTRKRAFLNDIGDIPGARERAIHDRDGDCGTVITYLFDDPRQAHTFAEALGCRVLIETGRHHYAKMEALMNRQAWNGKGCPFDCPSHPTTRSYSQSDLPHTDDILGRAVALSVGVSDSYLGPGFGVTPMSSPAEIKTIADELRERVSTRMGW